MYYRIFAALDAVPGPAAIEACLAALGGNVRCSFHADESGWYRAEFAWGEGAAIVVERFLADEDGIRAELNAWAGYLETKEASPHHQALMERTIQARQLFTIEQPDDHANAARLCEALCRHLAEVADGFFQIDDRGFFAADGSLLVAE
jgi:hypothetical protein